MIAEDVLQQFGASLRGQLLLPDQAGYEEGRKIFNAMIDRRPRMIVRCAGVADVIAAVKFARHHAIAVSVRGTGHNVAGISLCDGGMVIGPFTGNCPRALTWTRPSAGRRVAAVSRILPGVASCSMRAARCVVWPTAE